MIIDEDGEIDIPSDHNMIQVIIEEEHQEDVRKEENITYKWKLKNADWVKYRTELRRTQNIEGNVEETNRMLKQVINDVASEQIGKSKIQNGIKTKSWWTDSIKEAINKRKTENRIKRNLEKRKRQGEGVEEELRNSIKKNTKKRKLQLKT